MNLARKTYDEEPPRETLRRLVQAFQAVYSMPPWREDWPTEKVESKLREELKEGKLVLLLDSDEVIGFSWGAIINPQAVTPRVEASFPEGNRMGGLEELISILPERFFFWDEIALLPRARGLPCLKCLTLPILQFCREKEAKSILFRTTSQSKIIRITNILGFRPIFTRKVERLEEIYLFLDDLAPILEFAEMDIRQAAKEMSSFS